MNEQTNRIRLLLVDDQALFRESLSRLLASEPSLLVVGECGHSAQAIETLGRSPVDVVLADFHLAVERGGEFIATARRKGYQGRFLIIAGDADAKDAVLVIKLGAAGIFLKSDAPDRLVQAITLVANGAAWFDRRIIQVLADRPPGAGIIENPLTDPEQKVLLGILGGLTNRKIAENLGLTEGGVKVLVQHLFHRSGVRTRSHLVRVALEGSLGTARAVVKRTVDPATAGDGSNSGKARPPTPGHLAAFHQSNS